MSFKNYNGPDKYHFRVYKKGKGHPFIVALVEEIEIDGKNYISGYMFTSSNLFDGFLLNLKSYSWITHSKTNAYLERTSDALTKFSSSGLI